MDMRKIKPSGLFLAEILISILFFSLSAAVCVRFFVQSNTMISAAEETEIASEKCVSVTELMESTETVEEFCALLKDTFGIYPEFGKKMNLGYNENHEPADTEKAVYILNMEMTKDGDIILLNMQYVRTKDEKPVYSLQAAHHYPLEVSDGKNQ